METAQAQPPYTIAFVLIPRFNMLALTATIEPMRIANYITGKQLYAWRHFSDGGGEIVASNDMSLATEALDGNAQCDAVFVCGSWNSEHYESPALFSWLRRMDRRGVHLGAMDIGSYILARAKLLAGYRAAIHWYCINAFAESYPNIEAEERLFVVERNRTTIAGGTAGLDMMLNDIRERHGARLATEVAEQVFHFPFHGGDDPQRRPSGEKSQYIPKVLHEVIGLMEGNIEDPLTIPGIAARQGISQRKLERLFAKYMKCSAVSFYRVLRLQFARVLLTNTQLTIREISVASGYSSLSHFAKSFLDQFGKRPRDHRESWPGSEPAPVWPGTTASITNFTDAARRFEEQRRN